MTKYWVVFLFDKTGKEIWNSTVHFDQSDPAQDIWKRQGVWKDWSGVKNYVYVEGEFEEEE